MVEQTKMKNRSTTMYTPAKKRTGCNAPIVDDDVLDLISIEFLFTGLGPIKLVVKIAQ